MEVQQYYWNIYELFYKLNYLKRSISDDQLQLWMKYFLNFLKEIYHKHYSFLRCIHFTLFFAIFCISVLSCWRKNFSIPSWYYNTSFRCISTCALSFTFIILLIIALWKIKEMIYYITLSYIGYFSIYMWFYERNVAQYLVRHLKTKCNK